MLPQSLHHHILHVLQLVGLPSGFAGVGDLWGRRVDGALGCLDRRCGGGHFHPRNPLTCGQADNNSQCEGKVWLLLQSLNGIDIPFPGTDHTPWVEGGELEC